MTLKNTRFDLRIDRTLGYKTEASSAPMTLTLFCGYDMGRISESDEEGVGQRSVFWDPVRK
jgi:hypothetical protein